MESVLCGRAFRRVLAVAVLVLGAVWGGAGTAGAAPPDLGPNVRIFDPGMPQSEIQATLDAIANQQVSNQFGTERYALLFLPGTYGTPDQPLNFQVGYYTEVAGLGASPTDVVINGTADVYNQCFGPDNCTALVNFWRSLSNLTINVAGKSGCQTGEFWAVSQASPMRRVNLTGGNMTLMDYCTPPSYASGGFIADSQFSGGTIVNGSQQQFLVRNSSLDGWTNGVWNQVFAGDLGAPPQSFPDPPYTTLPTTPASRERPFLYVDGDGSWAVWVPAVQHDSVGPTWTAGPTPGRSVPLDDFFIARPGDSVATINKALRAGQDLLFTPGVYDVDATIKVKRPDTVVLGLGMATLTAVGGATPMKTASAPGIEIAGLIFDAGPVNSRVLLQVGSGHAGTSDANDPTTLSDVFFRIGGPHLGKATVSLKVVANDVILDDIWAWRADHGSGVGWTENTAANGLIVDGARVLATGLFVEHYQRYEVIWNGEDGETIMFQNEMPYDPPDQAAYRHSGLLGWASYKVAPWVTRHQGYGLGSYCFFNVNPTIHNTHAFEVPVTEGVQLHDILTLSITNAGTIDHVVNDFGPPTPPDTTPVDVVSYP
jgi:hypothetical protein